MRHNNSENLERLISKGSKFSYEYLNQLEGPDFMNNALWTNNQIIYTTRYLERGEWEREAKQLLSDIKTDKYLLNLFEKGMSLVEDAEDKKEYDKGLNLMMHSLKEAIKFDTTSQIRIDLEQDTEANKIIGLKDSLSRKIFNIENEIRLTSFKQDWEEMNKSNNQQDKRELELAGITSLEDFSFFGTHIFNEYKEVTGKDMIVLSDNEHDIFIDEALNGMKTYSDKEWQNLINKYKAKSISFNSLIKTNINSFEFWSTLGDITEKIVAEINNQKNRDIINKKIIKVLMISGISVNNENYLADAIVDLKIKSLDEFQDYIESIELLKQLKDDERNNLFDNFYATLKSVLKKYPLDKKRLWLDTDIFKSDELHFFRMQVRIWWIAKTIMESDLGNVLIIPAEILYAAAKWYQEYGDFKNAIYYYNKILLSENSNKTKLKVLKEAIYLYTGPLRDLVKFDSLVDYFEIQKNGSCLIQCALASYYRLRNYEKSLMIFEKIRKRKESYPQTIVKEMYISYIDLLNQKLAETDRKDEFIVDLQSNKIRIVREFEEAKKINILKEEDEYLIERDGNVINETEEFNKIVKLFEMNETFENALMEKDENHRWSIKFIQLLEKNIKNIKNDFENSKKANIDLENTIQILTAEIEKMKTPDYEEARIIEKLKNEIIYYPNLEKISRELLVLVEYLSLNYRLADSDYSPIILEYCKILEIELFEKFIRKFESWILQRGIYVQTGRDKEKDKNKFDRLTLGNYPILFNRNETKDFLRTNYSNLFKKMEKIEFSKKLDSITIIRNKCAHRGTLSLDDFQKVKNLLITKYNLLALIILFDD